MILLEGNQIWSPILRKFLPAANDFTVKMLPRLSVRNFFLLISQLLPSPPAALTREAFVRHRIERWFARYYKRPIEIFDCNLMNMLLEWWDELNERKSISRRQFNSISGFSVGLVRARVRNGDFKSFFLLNDKQNVNSIYLAPVSLPFEW